MGKLENDNILQTHFRERKKVSKDEDSFDSDLNQSFNDGAPEVFILKIIILLHQTASTTTTRKPRASQKNPAYNVTCSSDRIIV